MRRADRLIEMVGCLKAKTVVRAEEMAARLEVSIRTVYRDIAALQGMGLPIDGPALIVSSPDAGQLSHALADRFESELKAAGTRSVARLEIPENITEAEKIVAQRLAAEPRITQVFAVEHAQGLVVAVIGGSASVCAMVKMDLETAIANDCNCS